jgi:hypothetical protein
LLVPAELSGQACCQGCAAAAFVLDPSVDVVEGDVSLELERAVEWFEIGVVLAARVIGFW